ncbi:MAG: hypothetical protein V1843_04745, partial [bacterium]
KIILYTTKHKLYMKLFFILTDIYIGETMGVNRLLYHGTNALSVWQSAKDARGLNYLPHSNKGVSNQVNQKLFQVFGPAYPKVGREVCLVNYWGNAWTSAIEWKLEYAHNRLSAESSTQRRMPVKTEIFQSFGKDSFPALIPGAIIVANGYYLSKNNLLIPPKGEEDVIASYLPWSAIDAILFVDAYHKDPDVELQRISSFLFFNKDISCLLEKELKPLAKNKTVIRQLQISRRISDERVT